jgi:hypothetical protein
VPTGSLEYNIGRVRDFIDKVWNANWNNGVLIEGDITSVVGTALKEAEARTTPEFIRHVPVFQARRDQIVSGLDTTETALRLTYSMAPDLRTVVEHIVGHVVGSEAIVVARCAMMGIDSGGSPPLGFGIWGQPLAARPFKVTMVVMFRLVGGLIAEQWLISEELTRY